MLNASQQPAPKSRWQQMRDKVSSITVIKHHISSSRSRRSDKRLPWILRASHSLVSFS